MSRHGCGRVRDGGVVVSECVVAGESGEVAGGN
jgi:hypothetical protein